MKTIIYKGAGTDISCFLHYEVASILEVLVEYI